MFDWEVRLTVRDITEWHEARLELARSQVRRELVATIAATFVDALDSDIDSAVTGTLERIGYHAGADRVYLFRFSTDRSTMHRTHGWCRADQAFKLECGADIPADVYGSWRDQILDQRVVIEDRDHQGSESEVERGLLHAEGLRSRAASTSSSWMSAIPFVPTRVPGSRPIMRSMAGVVASTVPSPETRQIPSLECSSMSRSRVRAALASRAVLDSSSTGTTSADWSGS